MAALEKRKIKKSIIIVELDDETVHAVNSTMEENEVLLNLLKTMQGGFIDIDPDPIDGLEINLKDK